jgi:hypothetical protein
VVELEIQLDEIKEQYNNVIRNSSGKAQQKKMAFLERNLEQLTLVQKQVGWGAGDAMDELIASHSWWSKTRR